jgi:hypothetical protein
MTDADASSERDLRRMFHPPKVEMVPSEPPKSRNIDVRKVHHWTEKKNIILRK